MWREYRFDARESLRRWIAVFRAAFDATHPASAAERAAAILRERLADPPDLDSLALEVGMSRSTLTLHFRQYFGLSCGEYLTRVRQRWFVERLREPGAKPGGLARDAGFRRYHNLTDALRKRTGLWPGDVRRLTLDRVRELRDGPLALAPADTGMRRSTAGQAPTSEQRAAD